VSRSLTLALATPATANFGGDQSLAAILVIASGMLGALFGATLLKWLRIREGMILLYRPRVVVGSND
jgi:putative effector of murein hydrolase